jgi:tellurite resistance protein TerC
MDGAVRILRALNDGQGEEGDQVLAETDMSLAWFIFWASLAVLTCFDICVLAPKTAEDAEAMSGRKASMHVLFWFTVGLVFNSGVFMLHGEDAAIIWFNGYVLEYLLSVDNVFFFHVVFQAYATPASQVYKALFLGILIAVVLRWMFYVVGGSVFRLAFIVQVFFGLVLVYSGFKTAWSDEDDDDPRENRCVQLITRCLPLSDSYDNNGALFARLPKHTQPRLAAEPDVIGATNGHAAEDEAAVEPASLEASPPGSPQHENEEPVGDLKMRGTMLFLVVVVLGVIDLVFAVDSVTAKIAEYDSTFLNFSSSAFAMLCLRAMYFVLTRLLKYFRFLKYGVALILVLIGIKLIVSGWVEIDSAYSLATICGVFFLSMLISVIFPEPDDDYDKQKDDQDNGDMRPASSANGSTQAKPARHIDALDDDDLPMPEDFEIELR